MQNTDERNHELFISPNWTLFEPKVVKDLDCFARVVCIIKADDVASSALERKA